MAGADLEADEVDPRLCGNCGAIITSRAKRVECSNCGEWVTPVDLVGEVIAELKIDYENIPQTFRDAGDLLRSKIEQFVAAVKGER